MKFRDAMVLGMRYDLREGRFLSENDIDNATQVCVLGATVATELFGDIYLSIP